MKKIQGLLIYPILIYLAAELSEQKSASYMNKLSFLEQRIREVKDTGDEPIDTETLDIETGPERTH